MNPKSVTIETPQNLPLLSAEREFELGRAIQEVKSKKAKDDAIIELVEHNLRLVINEARKYSKKSSVSLEELYCCGREGLIKAAFNYNPVKYKTRFSTYAVQWIKQGIRKSIYKSDAVKIPAHIINGLYRKNKLIEQHGDLPNRKIKKMLKVTDAQLDKINKANVSSVSIDKPICGTRNSSLDGIMTLSEVIPDGHAKIPGTDFIKDPRMEYLGEAINELDNMSKDILFSQIMGDEKVKLRELGLKYKVTGERIRQLKQKALKHLRSSIEEKMSGKNVKI